MNIGFNGTRTKWALGQPVPGSVSRQDRRRRRRVVLPAAGPAVLRLLLRTSRPSCQSYTSPRCRRSTRYPFGLQLTARRRRGLRQLPGCSPDLPVWQFSTSVNTPGGPLKGFELNYQQPFTFLPAPCSTSSRLPGQLHPRDVERDLPVLDRRGGGRRPADQPVEEQLQRHDLLRRQQGQRPRLGGVSFEVPDAGPGRNGSDVEGTKGDAELRRLADLHLEQEPSLHPGGGEPDQRGAGPVLRLPASWCRSTTRPAASSSPASRSPSKLTAARPSGRAVSLSEGFPMSMHFDRRSLRAIDRRRRPRSPPVAPWPRPARPSPTPSSRRTASRAAAPKPIRPFPPPWTPPRPPATARSASWSPPGPGARR